MILKVKPIEVLWQTRQQDVFAEIARLLGVPSADSGVVPEAYAGNEKYPKYDV